MMQSWHSFMEIGTRFIIVNEINCVRSVGDHPSPPSSLTYTKQLECQNKLPVLTIKALIKKWSLQF